MNRLIISMFAIGMAFTTIAGACDTEPQTTKGSCAYAYRLKMAGKTIRQRSWKRRSSAKLTSAGLSQQLIRWLDTSTTGIQKNVVSVTLATAIFGLTSSALLGIRTRSKSLSPDSLWRSLTSFAMKELRTRSS